MCGVLALAREGLSLYLSATHNSLPPSGGVEVFFACARIALIVSVGLVVFGQYGRIKELSAQLTPATAPVGASAPSASAWGALASRKIPPRTYVRESGGEISKRMEEMPWTERDAVFAASYAGRWIRGRGTIVKITPSVFNDSINVQLEDIDPPSDVWGWFVVPMKERQRIEHLRIEDKISFEGLIAALNFPFVELKRATFELLP